MRKSERCVPFMDQLYRISQTVHPGKDMFETIHEFEKSYGDPFYIEEDDFIAKLKRSFVIEGINPVAVPNEIDEIGKLWAETVPDWRFGQLLVNVERSYGTVLDTEDFKNTLEQMHEHMYGQNLER